MNKKILGLLAASTAVVGNTIFATPARAVTQDVNVRVTVDEVLFLKTFDTVDLRVTQGDLGGAAESTTEGTTNGTNQLNLSGVTVGQESTSTEVIKDVNELYAVYGNAEPEDINVRITVDPTANELTHDTDEDFTAVMTVESDAFNTEARTVNDDLDIEGDEPLAIGGAQLKFEFRDDGDPSAPKAGLYTGGKVVVEAISIGDFSNTNPL